MYLTIAVISPCSSDYQLERPDGTVNPHSEPACFMHCVKFLQKVETIVALGPPQNDTMFFNTQGILVVLDCPVPPPEFPFALLAHVWIVTLEYG